MGNSTSSVEPGPRSNFEDEWVVSALSITHRLVLVSMRSQLRIRWQAHRCEVTENSQRFQYLPRLGNMYDISTPFLFQRLYADLESPRTRWTEGSMLGLQHCQTELILPGGKLSPFFVQRSQSLHQGKTPLMIFPESSWTPVGPKLNGDKGCSRQHSSMAILP